MNKKGIIFLLVLFSIFPIYATDSSFYFFVYFKDKTNSSFNIQQPEKFLSVKSIERRKKRGIPINESDLPINQHYLEILKKIDQIQIIHTSKWLNATMVKTSNKNLFEQHIKNLDFVIKTEYLADIKNQKKTEIHTPEEKANSSNLIHIDTFKNATDYWGKAYDQNNMIGACNKKFTGKGMTIAIFDAGFFMAYKTKGMQNLLEINTITKDFIDFDNSVWEDDKHGANCLSFMKTFNPGTYVGTAPDARYVLIRTEDAHNESLVEEVNWLIAAEFSDSIGVDIISSSLGYNQFDLIETNHTYKDLDGKTTIIAKAAEMAYAKGIAVINSAGNEGLSKWQKIGTPADAPNVITIGSVDKQGYYSTFSSKGFNNTPNLKPDFVAMGQKAVVASPSGTYTGNGTSYSTPIFAGAFACLMQAFPNTDIYLLKNALKQSASHYNNPDTLYGYGIPDFELAMMFLGEFKNPSDTLNDFLYINDKSTFYQYLPLHFWSKTNQNVTFSFTIRGKRKVKTLPPIQINVGENSWLHSYHVTETLNQLSKKQRKKYNQLEVIFQSNNMTSIRTFSINK
ncbi:MAG: S8 family serine peptidase [Bacteroidota bacterium]|nr:S8 family serine peptidase [Bacteroidota bacterium]